MFFDRFQSLNDELDAHLNGADLNFARYILPAQEGNLTVSCRYTPTFFGNSFLVLDANLHPTVSKEADKFYYGASPKLDSTLIMHAISELKLTCAEDLDAFVAEHADLFMLHIGQEKYLLPLARYLVLAFSYNYGITLKFRSKKEADFFLEKADDYGVFITKAEEKLILHGCPTKAMLDLLDGFCYILEDGCFLAVSPSTAGALHIRDIYHTKEHLSLVRGEEFYSGVLPRPLHIAEKESWHRNKNIISVCLSYERSTYATVFALDNNFTAHPLLARDRGTLTEFFYADDDCKRTYLQKPVIGGEAGRRALLADINDYLAHSYNVNQIGVTGNILSADGYLLYGKRGKKAEDSGKLYPSVNGNAEIADRDVAFYSDSADVDRPTLDITHAQNGFGGEIERECEAELNMALNSNLWRCYGLFLSGSIPKEPTDAERAAGYPHKKRRLHFNILYKQNTAADFERIHTSQRLATERYETAELHGLRVKVYRGRFDRILQAIEGFLHFLVKYRSIVTSAFTVALFFLSIKNITFSVSGWNSYLSAILAIIVAIITVTDTVREIRKSKKQRKYLSRSIHIIQNKKVEQQLNKVLSDFFDGKPHHPFTYMAVKLYLLEAVYGEA